MAVDDVSCIDIDLAAYAGPDTYVVSGGSVYIGRPGDVGIDDACIWYKLPNTTNSIDTAAGIWVSPTATSTYMVVQDICGNIKRDTVVVSLSGVGISELEAIQNDISLFPNPAADQIQLQFSLDISNPFTSLSIFNNFGQLIREDEIAFKHKKASVRIDELDNGVYFFELKNSSGQTVKKRFVVAR
ncbi:MAG: T9SS type A sorting domain-containing protein [Bacteroidia bacterium]|nr:T9SS type A sorting domain-containing protein [Bacteroidia bacterium]